MIVIVSLFAMLSFGVKAEDSPVDSTVASKAPQITTYTPEQLDQMLAPIALYPDSLVAQILMAATYPQEVVEAARWLQDPANVALHGNQLAEALQDIPWDPSVKALVVFPDIVRMMDSNLQWAEQLGDAFIGQQVEIMDEVQHLRQRAVTAGTLHSTSSQTVTTQDGIITIESTNPDVIYVPIYDPIDVYGTWPYPDYPPDYFTPDYVYGESLIDFGTGIFIVRDLFFFHHFDFRHHRIDIDERRFRFLNGGRLPIRSGIWAFDPAHRHDVPHHARELRGSLGAGQIAVPPPAQRPFRGFGANAAVSPSRQASPGVISPATQRIPASAPVSTSIPQVNTAPTVDRSRSFRTIERPSTPPSEIRRPSAPVFESHPQGFEARTQSERGQSSRLQMATPSENRSFGGGGRQGGGGNSGGGSNRSFGGSRGHR